MDRGPMTFTSDVSLPKDDQSASEVNKSHLGILTRLKTHYNSNYVTKERKGSKAWAVRQGK